METFVYYTMPDGEERDFKVFYNLCDSFNNNYFPVCCVCKEVSTESMPILHVEIIKAYDFSNGTSDVLDDEELLIQDDKILQIIKEEVSKTVLDREQKAKWSCLSCKKNNLLLPMY